MSNRLARVLILLSVATAAFASTLSSDTTPGAPVPRRQEQTRRDPPSPAAPAKPAAKPSASLLALSENPTPVSSPVDRYLEPARRESRDPVESPAAPQAPIADASTLSASSVDALLWPSIRWKEDSVERTWLLGRTDAGVALGSDTLLFIGYQRDELREPDLDTVNTNTAFLSFEQAFGPHHLNGEAGWYDCDSCDDDTWTANVKGRARWTNVSAEARFIREPHETARARLARIHENRVALTGWLGPFKGWTFRGYGQLGWLSDKNRRRNSELEIGREIPRAPGLRALYLFSTENMPERTDVYYSPNRVRTHQAGFDYYRDGPRRSFIYARYVPGYGDEKGTDSWWVHTADLNAGVEVFNGFQVEIVYSWSRSPTYRSRTCQAVVRTRF